MGVLTAYQKDIEQSIAQIQDAKIRDVLRAGSRGGEALHLTYLDSSIATIVNHILKLQDLTGIPRRVGSLPAGYPARLVK